MARYTMENDLYLALYFEATSAWHMAKDLGRSEGSIRQRVRKLKDCGAWDALKDGIEARERYLMALGIGEGA